MLARMKQRDRQALRASFMSELKRRPPKMPGAFTISNAASTLNFAVTPASHEPRDDS